MKKNKSLYSILLSLIIISSGCIKEDSLNTVSFTSFSDKNVFDTKDRIENQVRGFYAGLRSGQLYGSRVLIYNDAKSENFLSDDGNRITARAAWEFSELNTDNEVNNLWSACYSVINRVNLFLDGMSGKGDETAGADADSFKAEGRLVRALAYYTLLQFYSLPYPYDNGASRGVPLRLVGLNQGGQNDLASSSVAKVYEQIIDDLNFAENNLPTSYPTGQVNVVRAHKNTAIALKVRVYLSMANYPQVVTEANKIVSATAPFKANSGVAHELLTDYPSIFKTNNLETIFALPFTSVEQPGGQSQLGYYYLPKGVGGGQGIFYLNPAGIWSNTGWTTADVRRDLALVNGGKTWWGKFDQGAPFLESSPIIRYSEVLLSLAEALARTTNSVDARAVALLDAVRNRADATTSYSVSDFADHEALINAILTERNIEFLGEGIRSLDIIRLVQPYPAKSIPDELTIDAVPVTNQAYIWPIPSEETRYNKLVESIL